MLSVDEALALVLEHARPLSPARIAVREALGLMLAENIASDIDSPPHDKAMVDGYAVQAADFASGLDVFTILDRITAGDVPHCNVVPRTTSQIMTGAPLPPGADAVVMVEKSEIISDPLHLSPSLTLPPRVRFLESNVRSGQNILRRATSMRVGDVVLKAGRELRPIEIGLLAEVGRAQVAVVPRVKVAILSTGNELVLTEQTPGPGHIRNSNGPLLLAAVERAAATPVELGIARDEGSDLRQKISAGLQAADVLVLSGGVSAGVLDLVPEVLADLGVRQVFHKVQLKPGKPLWFGVQAVGDREKLVFGLPGNPVSSLVCFELFVRPTIEQMAGKQPLGLKMMRAQLDAPFQHRGDRPTFHPGRLHESASEPGSVALVTSLRWHGSADLRTLAEANALIHFPAGDRDYAAGESVGVRLFA